MSALVRVMVPVAALGLGTWLGMGRPDARTTFAAGTRAAASVASAVHARAPDLVPAPLLDRPSKYAAPVKSTQ